MKRFWINFVCVVTNMLLSFGFAIAIVILIALWFFFHFPPLWVSIIVFAVWVIRSSLLVLLPDFIGRNAVNIDLPLKNVNPYSKSNKHSQNGFDLQGIEIDKEKDVEEVSAEKEILTVCDFCGTANDNNDEICKSCGASLLK